MTWSGPTIGVMRPGFLAVSGCRPPNGVDPVDWRVYEAITLDVEGYVEAHPAYRIAHGGAVGVDRCAALASHLRGERYLPNYERDGRAAPMIRNSYVTTTELFCAWPAPWSRGTWDAVEKRLRACGGDGFELRLVGWGKHGAGVPEKVKRLLDLAGKTWTEIG